MTLNIVYTCDHNYVWIMATSMVSLFENNAGSDEICVYLLGESISKEDEDSLTALAESYGREFYLIPTDDVEIDEDLFSAKWPKSAYMRLFCDRLLPEAVSEAIYLDCDTLVMGDISRLEEYCRLPYAYQGVIDCIGRHYKQNIGLGVRSNYVNAGVLCMNLDVIRTLDTELIIRSFIATKKKMIGYADQDILNAAFGTWNSYIREPEYNATTQVVAFDFEEIHLFRHPGKYYPKEDYDRAHERPVIVHFTSCMMIVRPWYSNATHPYSGEFDRYLAMTPYKETPRREYEVGGAKGTVYDCASKLPRKVELAALGFVFSVARPAVKRIAKSRYRIG